MDQLGEFKLQALQATLQAKIAEVNQMKQLILKQLSMFQGMASKSLNTNRKLSQAAQQIQGLKTCQNKLSVQIRSELQQIQTEWMSKIVQIRNHYEVHTARLKETYSKQIQYLEGQLQIKYKLTANMKAEVEELKSLIDRVVLSKETPPPKQNTPKLVVSNPETYPTQSTQKPNNLLQVIEEEEENQSTRRETSVDDINLDQIVFNTFPNTAQISNSDSRQSFSSKNIYLPPSEVTEHKARIEQCQSPNAIVTRAEKPKAKFFLNEFKNSMDKSNSQQCLSSNSKREYQTDTKHNRFGEDLEYCLDDSSSKLYSSKNSTPTGGGGSKENKVFFGNHKALFFHEDQPLQRDRSDTVFEDRRYSNNPQRPSQEPKRNGSKSTEKLSTKRIMQVLQRDSGSSYLNAHMKKKKSLLNSEDSQNISTPGHTNRQTNADSKSAKKLDRYQSLIKNILLLKEKENVGSSSQKNVSHKNGSMPSADLGFTVGDKKLEVKYEGSKRDGKRNGRGILHYSNGLCFQGQFRDNARCGYGILKFNHIEIYNGDWQNDALCGQGRVKNCSVINKRKKQDFNCLGKWISYSGEFKDNKFHGTGTLFLQSGQKFLGRFCNGVAQGEGTFYRSNGEVEFGIWKGNTFELSRA